MKLIGRFPEYRIGPMTLLVGDCTEILADLDKVDERASLLVTDPPYKLTSGGRNSNSMGGKFSSDVYDNSGNLMKITPWKDMPAPLFNACRQDCDAYVMANGKNIFLAYNAFIKAGWKVHELLNWKKESPSRSRFYMKDTEYILYLWKGRARDINNGGTTQHLPYRRPKDAIHLTQKPIDLLQVMIENSSEPGELVLDPFAGSGSTLVASMISGRRALGIEFCPENAERAAVWMQSQYDQQRRLLEAVDRSCEKRKA